jgi:hypothetical protein
VVTQQEIHAGVDIVQTATFQSKIGEDNLNGKQATMASGACKAALRQHADSKQTMMSTKNIAAAR